MIVARAWAGRRYAVLGLARSGMATVRALLAGGAHVVAWDSEEAKRHALKPLLFRGGVEEEDAASAALFRQSAPSSPSLSSEEEGSLTIAPLDDLVGFDALVVSPGVPLNTHPLAEKARAAGVPVIGDIELFAEARADLPPHKVVGITGTNGKSTTTALVHHILASAGVPSLMGGNIGLPILAQEPLPDGGVYVLELSSYQLDLTRSLDCDVAVLTNITPDHLDRYESFTAYADSKARLFAMQSPGDLAIIGVDDEPGRRIAQDLRDHGRTEMIEVTVTGFDGQAAGPALAGPHNAQNVACARLVAAGLQVPLGDSLRTFPGLPHRMQRVATLNGVAFVNDSKATNPDSTAPALGAYPRIHWIVGGRAKGDDLDACVPYLGNVAAAYTIGEAGPRFFALLQGRVPVVEQAVTIDVAVRHAAAVAQAGEVVLLSPACASFDQFQDYEDRGRAFTRAVAALPTGEGA